MAAPLSKAAGNVAAADISARACDAARGWPGTPYRHQASLKGVGADCLGLVRGVWRELYGREPEAIPPYSRDWCEVSKDEYLWRAASRLMPPAFGEAPGDVLLFRMVDGAPAKHLAIRGEAGGRGTIIHAYSGRSVVESPFITSWRRRLVAVFRFPEEV